MRTKLLCTLLGTFAAAMLSASADAQIAGQRDDQRIQLYAIALGRASACGVRPPEMEGEMKRVARWVESQNAETKQEYLMTLMVGMETAGQQQLNGETGDSCADVKRQFKKIKWP